MRNNSIFEENSLDDSQATEGSLLSQLWEMCELSQSPVRLVLPDNLNRPFYLPKIQGVRNATKIQSDRAVKRNEYLSQRDIPAYLLPKTKRTIPKFKFHMKKDREIEASLMDIYRHDNEKLSVLLKSVALKRKIKVSDKMSPRNPKLIFKDKQADMISRQQEMERQQQASRRKHALLQMEEESRIVAAEILQSKMSQVATTSSVVLHSKALERVKCWVTIVAVLNKLAVFTSIVVAARKVKAKDLKKWKACIVIQKAYRHYLHRRRKRYPGCKLVREYSSGSPKMMGRMRKSIAGNEILQQRYYQRRDSCNLIIKVLKASLCGFKARVHAFIRKVKVVQRMVRAHVLANTGRYHLMLHYLDECYPALNTHLSVVSADRGLDLNNVSSMEMSKIKIHTTARNKPRLISDFNTPGFHHYLRTFRDQLSDINSVFGSTTKHLYNAGEYSSIKRRCILNIVFKLRKKYVARLFAEKKMVLKIPPVTLQDVRSFISGGCDPISTYMQSAIDKYESLQAQQLDASRSRKLVYVDAHGNKTILLRVTCMNLLSSLCAEDIALMYVTITEQCVEYKAASGRRQTNHRLLVGKGVDCKPNTTPVLPSELTVTSASDKPQSSGSITEYDNDDNGDKSDVDSDTQQFRPASPPGRKISHSLLESTRKLVITSTPTKMK